MLSTLCILMTPISKILVDQMYSRTSVFLTIFTKEWCISQIITSLENDGLCGLPSFSSLASVFTP